MIKNIRKEYKIRKSITFRIDENLLKDFDIAIKKTGVKKTFIAEEAIKEFCKKVLGKEYDKE